MPNNINDFSNIVAIDAVVDRQAGDRCQDGEIAVHILGGDTAQQPNFKVTPAELKNLQADLDRLWVTTDARAVCAVFHSIGVEVPKNLADLTIEEVHFFNGRVPSPARDHSTALVYAGELEGPVALDAHEPAERDQDTRVPPVVDENMNRQARRRRLAMCERLVRKLVKHTNIGAALQRGDYLKALTVVQEEGLPIDVAAARALVAHREELAWGAVDKLPPLPDGKRWHEPGETGMPRLRHWALQRLAARESTWPGDAEHAKSLDNDTIDAMAIRLPCLVGLADARRLVDAIAHMDVPIGQDGRHRFDPRPFGSATGRNQPLTTSCLLAKSKWVRHLIRAPKGRVLIVADFRAQEVGNAAAISGDQNLVSAYLTGDAYIAIGIMLGLAPIGATKESHPHERAVAKGSTLAVLYGAGPGLIALRAQCSTGEAKALLAKFAETFSVFWAWRENTRRLAQCQGYLETSSGWRVLTPEGSNYRSHINFPLQAAGADILRHATVTCVAETAQTRSLRWSEDRRVFTILKSLRMSPRRRAASSLHWPPCPILKAFSSRKSWMITIRVAVRRKGWPSTTY